MGNVINLNRFRKRAEREASAKQADQAKAHLDQHRIDREEQP